MGVVMPKIFSGGEDVFRANHDVVAVGCCEGNFVLVMALQVWDTAVMEKIVYGVITALGQF